MHSPSLALNWQIWSRHRWGLAAALLTVAAVCAIPQAYTAETLLGDLGETRVPILAVLLMPFGFVMFYLAFAFSHAELGSRPRSGFPQWMLTLPVRTESLVIWPMLAAAATVALAWIAVSWFALNAVGFEVPLFWPALALACSFVWIQAIDWSPLGFAGKASIAVGVLGSLWAGLMRSAWHDTALACLPILLPLGVVAGILGVNRLRHGEAIGIAIAKLPARPRQIGSAHRFAGIHQAQFWLEWRRNGTLLPMFAAGGVLLELIDMIFYDGTDAGGLIFAAPFLLTLLAPLVGLLLGKPDVWNRRVRLAAFAASRPINSGEMVLAKFRMTALSLLAAWLILAFGFGIWLVQGSHYSEFRHPFRQHWWHLDDPYRFALMFATFSIGCFGFQWLLLAGSIAVSLAGRSWLILATLFLYLGVIPNLIVLVTDTFHLYESDRTKLTIAGLALKFLLAAWAFRRSYQRGFFSASAIAGLIGIWCLTVFCATAANYLWIPDVFYRRGYPNELPNDALVLGLFLLAGFLLVAGRIVRQSYRRGRITLPGILGVAGVLAIVAVVLILQLIAVDLGATQGNAAENSLDGLTRLRSNALMMVLLTPLARLGLAPLSLAWNRHR